MMNNTKRTDQHRKGAIVPGDYRYVLSYWVGDSENPDGYGMDDLLSLRKSGAKFFGQEHSCKCDACGARFKTGDVWRHVPTDEHIHLGHDCAYKYGLLVDRSAFELALQRKINDEERAKFLAEHPGLAEDFELADKHYIIRNIKSSFMTYRSISEKQIALVHKLAEEIRNPAPEEQVTLCDAPSGRVAVSGTVLGVKYVENAFGGTLKMLVLFVKDDGSQWKGYGTAPDSLFFEVVDGNHVAFQGSRRDFLKGKKVSFTAKFEPKEIGFAFFSRPTKAMVV